MAAFRWSKLLTKIGERTVSHWSGLLTIRSDHQLPNLQFWRQSQFKFHSLIYSGLTLNAETIIRIIESGQSQKYNETLDPLRRLRTFSRFSYDRMRLSKKYFIIHPQKSSGIIVLCRVQVQVEFRTAVCEIWRWTFLEVCKSNNNPHINELYSEALQDLASHIYRNSFCCFWAMKAVQTSQLNQIAEFWWMRIFSFKCYRCSYYTDLREFRSIRLLHFP